jgi:hypothetical protein
MPESMTPEERADFIARVATLSEKLDVSEAQRLKTEKVAKEAHDTARRQKWTVRALLLLFAVTAFYVNEQREDGQDIERNAVTNCENANQSREVQRNLWNGIFNAPRDPDDPPRSATEDKNIGLLLGYINTAFQERDCDDLGREYPAPEFPEFQAEDE